MAKRMEPVNQEVVQYAIAVPRNVLGVVSTTCIILPVEAIDTKHETNAHELIDTGVVDSSTHHDDTKDAMV